MKLIFFVVLTFFSFVSCVPDKQFTFVEPYDVFHDNSSKVWLVDKVRKIQVSYSLKSIASKSVIVFHKSHNCYQFDMTDFGKHTGLKGTFELNYQKKEMYIYFQSKKLSYKIHKLSSETIVLSSLNQGEKEFLQLRSFPEISD